MEKRVLVTGATSAMGRAFVKELAIKGHSLILAGRSEAELESVATDTRIRFGVQVEVCLYDALAMDAAARLEEDLTRNSKLALHGVVFCHGFMPDEVSAETDTELREATIRVNYISTVNLIEVFKPYLSVGEYCFFCTLTSVAGDRGRPSNALYGSSKGALSLYLSGFRSRVFEQGIRVVNVKPGFVDTRMTWGLPGLFAVARPETVAVHALQGVSRNHGVVYSPKFWRLIMLLIRVIPDIVFRRLKI